LPTNQQQIAYERAEGGLREGIVSPAERDNAKFSYEQAKASLDVQEVQLTHLTIRAPINGVITQRSLQQGMLVSSGTPAFTIVDPASYVLPINVNERYLPRLRVGQEAFVTIDSAGDREFKATVRRINPGVDLQNSAIKVILDFDAKDHKYLREAAFARYRLVMDTRKDTLAVPKDAIIEDNTRRYVMLVRPAPSEAASDGAVEDGIEPMETEPVNDGGDRWVATRVEVEVGLSDSDYTEIVSGVAPDDRVITLGQQTVNDGDAVEISSIEEALAAKESLDADAALETAKKRSEAEPENDNRKPRRRGP
jgi:multidrug efflux pump subunit AcrA (membrane-fusion protein)